MALTATNLIIVFFLLTSPAYAKVGEVSFQTQQAQISRGADKILTEVGTGVEMDDEIETLDGTVRIIFLDKTKVTILFSPGTSSYDQYKNFEVRGNHFKKLINAI